MTEQDSLGWFATVREEADLQIRIVDSGGSTVLLGSRQAESLLAWLNQWAKDREPR